MERIEIYEKRIEKWRKMWHLQCIYFNEACREMSRMNGLDINLIRQDIINQTNDTAIKLKLLPIQIPDGYVCNLPTKQLIEIISNLIFNLEDKKITFKNQLKDIDKKQIIKFFKSYNYKIRFKKNEVLIELEEEK